MSLVNEMGPADLAAVTGNNGNSAWGGDGAWWIIILFLFALTGNGWGGNFGGGNGAVPYMMNSYTNNDVQRGFDQAAIMGGINGITAGLANAEVSRCNAQTNILAALNNNQVATTAGMNSLAMGLQQCLKKKNKVKFFFTCDNAVGTCAA